MIWPLHHASPSKAGATAVVFPAPGGATSTAPLFWRKAASRSGNTAWMGRSGFTQARLVAKLTKLTPCQLRILQNFGLQNKRLEALLSNRNPTRANQKTDVSVRTHGFEKTGISDRLAQNGSRRKTLVPEGAINTPAPPRIARLPPSRGGRRNRGRSTGHRRRAAHSGAHGREWLSRNHACGSDRRRGPDLHPRC